MLRQIKLSKLTCLFLIVILTLSFFQINVMANVTLTISEEFSLSNPSITPEEGRRGTEFTYKIKYTDPENKEPIWKYVYIKDVKWGWRLFEMKHVSGEFDEGAIYEFNIKLYTPGDYKYYFFFTNEEDGYLRYPGDENQYLHGPTVLEDDIVEHYAVIICGWADNDKDQEAFERSTTRAHNALRKQGYSDKNIYHLRKDTSNERVDDELNYDTAKYALEVWLPSHANKNSKCLVYLNGHGTDYGGFTVDEGKRIIDYEVSNWLRDLECKTLTVVVECCFAGNFIDDLSGHNRIIITSTNSYLKAHRIEYPDESAFSKFFFEALDDGKSYGGAWEAAEKTIAESLPGDAAPLINRKAIEENNKLITLDNDMQIPLIDDNGDGIGHGTAGEDDLPLGGDGALAKNTYPGYDHDNSRFISFRTVINKLFGDLKIFQILKNILS